MSARVKARWDQSWFREQRLVEEGTGLIVGTITKGWHSWTAHADVRGNLGAYVSEEHAKQAVELALRISHEVVSGSGV